MAFQLSERYGHAEPDVMNEINMTPLVDVMLVLLIVFIITVPVMKHAIPVNLPKTQTSAQATPPQTLRLSVDAKGDLSLDGQALSTDALQARLQAQSRLEPQPALQVLGDKAVPYEHVTRALALVKEAGLQKVALITDPRP